MNKHIVKHIVISVGDWEVIVGWLVGWLVGCLIGWLIGWLVYALKGGSASRVHHHLRHLWPYVSEL